MKALITGVSGFVGKHLTNELTKKNYEVVGTDLHSAQINIDLMDYAAVKSLIADCKPNVIFHLAGQSSVGVSWKNPILTFNVNVNATINLLNAVKDVNKLIRVIIIGSSDEYGKVAKEDCPIKETLIPNPQNPYAVSKFAQEQMALLYVKAYNLDVVLTRSFNHTGPFQNKGFVISDFASQLTDIEKGAKPVIYVGNLEAKRDISDVRDIVRGYRLLGEKGKSGEIYNIGAGKAYSIQEILDMLIKLSKVNPKIVQDKKRLRPVDIPLIICNMEKIKKDTGYVPIYSITDTLIDTLEYWNNLH